MIPRVARLARTAVLSSAITACFVPVDAAATAEGGTLRFVTNCNDSGPGSLRDTVASAISGDSIDLAQMGCSTLTLTTGAVVVPQDDLTIKYSSELGRATISGGLHDRVFQHTGTGTLEIDHLAITHGKYESTGDTAQGGCIDSPSGRVVLQHSVVSYCVVHASDAHVDGGGIYAHEVGIYYSDVTGNEAVTESAYDFAVGGGIATTLANISYSTITNNEARSGRQGFGGGLDIVMNTGVSSINHTLIARNVSSSVAGGIQAESRNSATLLLTDSTVYANETGALGGGVNMYEIAGELRNDTIASNISRSHYWSSGAPGLSIEYNTLRLSSSIVSGNETFDIPADGQVYTLGAYSDTDHDLVFGPSGAAVSPGTITSDPLLLPLTDNGGSTQTMAIRPDSPAVDQGIASDGLTADQRGPGFARLVGAAVDIGAFERQGPEDGDRIMIGGFDPP